MGWERGGGGVVRRRAESDCGGPDGGVVGEIGALAERFSEEWGGGKRIGDGSFGRGGFTGVIGSGTGSQLILAGPRAFPITNPASLPDADFEPEAGT